MSSRTEYTELWKQNNYKQITTKLPKDLVKRFKEKCESDGISQNSVIWKGIQDYVEKED